MSRKNISILFAVLLLIFVLFYATRGFGGNGSNRSINQNSNINLPTSTENTPTEEGYTPFNADEFARGTTKRRVLFFYAGWCTTCRPVNAQFLENSNQIPDDVIVYRVNFRDSDTDEAEKLLAEKYKITYQHTFVQINQQGDVIKKWNGGNLADLIKNVN